MLGASDRNFGCRIKDDLVYRGMRTIIIENEMLRVGILQDKGSDIFEFLYKPLDLDFIWLSPIGIKNPSKYILTKNQPGGRFMDFYEGGWQEIFPNGGGPSSYRGAEFGQHDEVSLLPWESEIIEDDPSRVVVSLSVDARLTPIRLEKNLKLEKGKSCLTISEKAINKSSVDIPVIWGHHLAYGEPFLEEGSRIGISAAKGTTYNIPDVMDENIGLNEEIMWPMLTTKEGDNIDLSIVPSINTRTSKFLYLSGLERGLYEIENSRKKAKIRVEWDLKVMPYVWFWQEFNKTESYPWYGMSRVIGLEPFSTDIAVLENTVKNNRQLLIGSNSYKEFQMKICVINI
jgi:hypothetical protein